MSQRSLGGKDSNCRATIVAECDTVVQEPFQEPLDCYKFGFSGCVPYNFVMFSFGVWGVGSGVEGWGG